MIHRNMEIPVFHANEVPLVAKTGIPRTTASEYQPPQINDAYQTGVEFVSAGFAAVAMALLGINALRRALKNRDNRQFRKKFSQEEADSEFHRIKDAYKSNSSR